MLLTGEDVEDVFEELVAAQEGNGNSDDDDATEVAGPTAAELFSSLLDKARAAGLPALDSTCASWNAATRQTVLDPAAPFYIYDDGAFACALDLMTQRKKVLLRPAQKRTQANMFSLFDKRGTGVRSLSQKPGAAVLVFVV